MKSLKITDMNNKPRSYLEIQTLIFNVNIKFR